MALDVIIAWTASLLFFGVGQAIVMLIMTRLPREADEGLRYFYTIWPGEDLLHVGGLALLLSVGLTWNCALSEAKTIEWYILSAALTVLAFLCYIFATRAIRNCVIEWLRELIKQSPSSEPPK